MTLAVGQSGGSYSTVTHTDFTQAATGVPLGQDGEIIMTQDPVSAVSWEQTTVNSIPLYWLRIRFSGALTASITIATNYILPWYPSIDPTIFPFDGLDKSGCYPHILFGRSGPQGQQTPIWHDMFSVMNNVAAPPPDKIGPIVLSNLGVGGTNNKHDIILFGQKQIWRIGLAADDRPGTEARPYPNNVGLIEFPGFSPSEGKICRLIGVKINGHSFDHEGVGIVQCNLYICSSV